MRDRDIKTYALGFRSEMDMPRMELRMFDALLNSCCSTISMITKYRYIIHGHVEKETISKHEFKYAFKFIYYKQSLFTCIKKGYYQKKWYKSIMKDYDES